MKKILVLFLSLIFSMCFIACSGGEDAVTPEYSNKYSYNDELHWRNQLNGNGRTDVSEHIDDGTGTCPTCKYVLYVASFANEWSFDDEYHWKEQTNGTGIKDKAKHVNDSGKCRYCAYYYDATEFIRFEKCTIGGVVGYRVMELLDEEYDEDYFYFNIEVPTHYQGEDDESPLPVISIGYGALGYGNINGTTYNQAKIKSVKLNEGLLEIRDWAFKNSDITELVIPDSVTNAYFRNTNMYKTYGTIYNICGGCPIKRFVVGDGIKVLYQYNFGNGVIEVKLGNGLTTISPRAFYEVKTLDYLVIPASVNKIPEGTVDADDKTAKPPIIQIFPVGAPTKIFMEITKAEHDALLVDQRKRDLQGNILNPLPDDAIGFVKGWSGNCPIYFKGEWHYNKYGKPVPNI